MSFTGSEKAYMLVDLHHSLLSGLAVGGNDRARGYVVVALGSPEVQPV